MKHQNPYQTYTDDNVLFTFSSRGERDIIKVVFYSFLQDLESGPLYNLGFGDYTSADRAYVDDSVDSNNGDMYRVFETVLSTIPIFFEERPWAQVFATGSDALRTKIYHRFVNQHYEALSESYRIRGCYVVDNAVRDIESYIVGNSYDGIIVSLK